MLKGKNVEVSLIEIDGSQAIYNARAFFSHNQGSMFTIIFSKENINTFISQLIEENYTEESIEDVDNTENGMFIPGKNSRIWIRTFGSFDIFVNGVPIRFSSAKSKELLAVLVDRRGGSLSAEEAIAYLWEDKPADKQVMTNYRKVAMRMQETLNNYGIGDLVINNKGLRSLNMAIVDCDLYRFILKDKTYTHFFHGQYMQNYSWAENTLATLYQIAGDLDLEDKKGWIETQIF